MYGTERTLEMLLELGSPLVRRTRAEQVEHAMRVAIALADADAVIVRPPGSRRGRRLALHAGSAAPALLPPPTSASGVLRAFADKCAPLLVKHLAEDPGLVEADDCPGTGAGPAMFIPLRQRDPQIGYLATYRRRGRAPFVPGDARLLLLLAAWLSAALEGLRLASGTERLFLTDDMTDVYNERFVHAALRRELRRAARHAQELSVVVIELHDLAAFRSEHGELRGSALLTDVALQLAQQPRAFDLLGRLGTEGFLLILPQTDRDGATAVAERIRAAIAGHAFAPAPAGAITAGVGVATFPADGADAPALLAAASRATRRGRSSGGTVDPDAQEAA